MGAQVTDAVYYHYNAFLALLDQLFPARAGKVLAGLEPLRFGRLRWLGDGFLLKAKKRARVGHGWVLPMEEVR